MRRKIYYFLCLIVLPILLMGCSKYKGKLDEGKISCAVALDDIPESLSQLAEKSEEDINISISLTNLVTNKYYDFDLNEENHFRQDATLDPGKYTYICYTVTPLQYSIEMNPNEDVLEVGPDKANYLGFRVTNEEKIAIQLQDEVPSKEIVKADQFSRKVQLQGQIIDLEHITDYVTFESEEMIPPYQYGFITNQEQKVTIEVLNESEQPASWEECKLVQVNFMGSNVVLAGGVNIGMLYRDVTHNTKGIYGIPDKLDGSIMFGMGMDPYIAYYNDASSGDQIMVESDNDGKYVKYIRYRFEAFE